MTQDIEELRKQQFAEFFAFRTALTAETDRGCALFAAAFLDEALAKLLRSCMVQGKKMDEDLFVNPGPLSTFSSRTKLAYYMGKLSASERKDIDTIRSIRNDFAHHAQAIDFNAQSVRDRCGNLVHGWHAEDHRPRGKFTASVCGLLARINVEIIRATAPKEQAETPVPEELKAQIRKNVATVLASGKPKSDGDAT
jgi:hypothetical protein